MRSREAMVSAATELLTKGGLDAVTHQTVAVCARGRACRIRRRLRDDVTAGRFAIAAVGAPVHQRLLVGTTLGHDPVEAVVDAALRAWAP
ncbi:hypothetical protein [Streptomyces sp. NPDC096311]|uniref:hypothetical protein n=1 Tax=Streptomyces sp. NPDC096311 TaxID=3366083 RepID=UPI00381EFC6F